MRQLTRILLCAWVLWQLSPNDPKGWRVGSEWDSAAQCQLALESTWDFAVSVGMKLKCLPDTVRP